MTVSSESQGPTHPAPSNISPSLVTPSIRRRMACWLYEGILMFGVVFIASYLFDTLSQSRHALDNRHLRMAFLFVVFGIYFAWFWAKGQTLAQKTWHIKVTSKTGTSISQSQALLRYVLSWVWFIPPLAAYSLGVPATQVLVLLGGWVAIWAILSRFHPTQQFWHDALAGTRLVHFDAGKK